MHRVFNTSGTCSVQIEFDIDDEGCLHNIRYLGGCDGNLKAIGLLAEGKNASEVADLLGGLRCGFKQTSCGDQLSKAIREAGY
ncbi:MAG: TIGR03905 family TSCPD domain-containing protein [Eubacteriales bacterium]|nr:TIGR03905 family TSCPD domain-containing protein [Eubacteriales bacterium]